MGAADGEGRRFSFVCERLHVISRLTGGGKTLATVLLQTLTGGKGAPAHPGSELALHGEQREPEGQGEHLCISFLERKAGVSEIHV